MSTTRLDRLPQYYRCGECCNAPASVDCKDCAESYCQDCTSIVHSKGMRKSHTRFTRLFVCQRCVANPATMACGDCDGRVYCDRCNSRVHGTKGKYKKHTAIQTVAEYYPSGEKAVAINRDEQNGFNLKVDALVASPARFARSANAVDAAAADAAEVSRITVHVEKPDPAAVLRLRFEASTAEDIDFLYSESDPHAISVAGIEDRVWGWRRLSKMHPDGCLFDVGNTALATQYKYAKPLFPPADAPDVAESLGLKDAVTEVPSAVSLPRPLNTRPRDAGLDESGFDLALLSTALAGTSVPLASVFHSVAHRAKAMYSLQYYHDHTAAEEIIAKAESAGMPLTERSPVRRRGGGDGSLTPAATASPPRQLHKAKDDEAPLAPNEQDHRIEEAVGQMLSLDFLQRLYRPRRSAVTIDDLVPIGKDGRPVFGLTEFAGERWKVMLEKGYARFNGSYASLEGANPVSVLRCLTGGRVVAESWSGSSEANELFPDVAAAARFAWWKVEAAKRVGQLVLLSHRAAVHHHVVDPRSTSPGVEDRDAELDDVERQAIIASSTVVEGQESPVALQANNSMTTRKRPPSAVDVPPMWGTEAWATAAGETMDPSDAAIALFTAELSVTAANTMGFRRTTSSGAPPSDDGWRLAKLHQVGGELGAERFSYAHFSGQWTKELREYFDFKAADHSLVFATPEDLAEEFDTVTTCAQYVGAPPSASFVLSAQPSEDAAHDKAAQILIVLRRGVHSLSISNAAAFDLREGKAVHATASLSIRLNVVPPTLDAWLKPFVAASGPEATTPIPVPPLVSVNVALGITEPLPDRFLARSVPSAEPEGGDVGTAIVLLVNQTYHRDAVSAVLGFDPKEVAFLTVL